MQFDSIVRPSFTEADVSSQDDSIPNVRNPVNQILSSWPDIL